MQKNNQTILTISNLTKNFRGLKVINNLCLKIKENTIHAIIGPNGAGKTTLINLLTGFIKDFSGTIYFKDKPIELLSPPQIALKGIRRTFQNLQLAEDLKVKENLLLTLLPKKVFNLFKNPFTHSITQEKSDYFYWLANSLDLNQFLEKKTKEIPYGIKKKVELMRALLAKPSVLVLDEPVAGLNPQEKKTIARFLKSIQKQEKLTIILIEHDLSFLKDLASVVSVINSGKLIFNGATNDAFKDAEVLKAYLGNKKD